jgi:Bacterial Ig-like domain/Dockerin type I domain
MDEMTPAGTRGGASGKACLVETLEPRRLLAVTPVGGEFRVNTAIANNQRFASVAADADGNFVVTWQSYAQDGSSLGVYAQRYTAAGAAAGGEFSVNTTTANRQRFPSVAMDADGDFVITWESYAQDGSQEGVYAKRYNAQGVPQPSPSGAGEFRVNTTTAGRQSRPDAAMDADGDFVIAWSGNGGDSSVFAQRFTAAGIPAGGELAVSTPTPAPLETHVAPAVAMDADGDFVVAWEGDPLGTYHIYARRYNAAGEPAGAEFRVSTFQDGIRGWAAASMSAAGDFVVAWHGSVQDTSGFGIFARRYGADGAAAGEEIQVNTTTGFDQTIPAVAMDDTGDFLIAWTGRDVDPENVRDYGNYARQYTSAGAPDGGEVLVNTTLARTQWIPAVASDADGDFVIAWESDGQDGSDYGVYARRYRKALGAGGRFLHESAPHRFSVTFNREVSEASLEPQDVTVQRLPDGASFPASAVSYDPATRTATFTLSDAPLENGNYRATLAAGAVADTAGQGLAAAFSADFLALAGDLNRSRSVDGTDFAILAGKFGQSGMTFAQGDLNGDGSVNGSDFAILAGNFGRAVPAPAAAVVTLPAAGSRQTPLTTTIRQSRARRRLQRMRVK